MTGGHDGDPLDRPLKIHGAGSSASSAPKRFYQAATVDKTAGTAGGGTVYRVLLDGRPVRTPAKRPVELPTRSLAEAVASEWAAQGERIDPAGMPMMRLVNSALDGVCGREREVAADIVKYAGNDLLSYRALEPEALTARQAAAWDPILDWAGGRLGGRFRVAVGILHVEQDAALLTALAGYLTDFDPLALASLHVMTTISGSALIAWSIAEAHLTPEAAWAVAHVDEDWQIEKWGEDFEASARRQHRWRDFDAAARLLPLIGR